MKNSDFLKQFVPLTREELKKVIGGSAGMCGQNAGGATCPGGECCSKWGYCGTGIDYCGGGCSSGNCYGPGGDNGNPCPQYCEPTGGSIWCVGTINGVHYVYDTNCNQHPYNPNLHNRCMNEATGNFWC